MSPPSHAKRAVRCLNRKDRTLYARASPAPAPPAQPPYEPRSVGCGARCAGRIEAVKVSFDPIVVSYESLTRLFFDMHDPTTGDRCANSRRLLLYWIVVWRYHVQYCREYTGLSIDKANSPCHITFWLELGSRYPRAKSE